MLDAGPLVISELMAENNATLLDQDLEYSDWIEIHNPTNATVDLDGWYLTDDVANPTLWQFPAVTIRPDKYLVVFASGKDLTDTRYPLHTNFRLDAGGEYLGLLRPDGLTVSHEYAPEFPRQSADVSYGMSGGTTAFLVPDDAQLKYHVPTPADVADEAAWKELAYDDSSWDGFAQHSSVLITEAGTEDPDFIEIQNVSDRPVDTSGWVVALNVSTTAKIHLVDPILWELPPLMAGDQVLYRHDDAEESEGYWGGPIQWRTLGYGWAMIVDDVGNVADFVVWGYDQSQIQSFSVTINSHEITLEDAWIGEPVVPAGAVGNSLQRRGGSDHDSRADWGFIAPSSPQQVNSGLATPFTTDVATGIGFDAAATGLAGAFTIDVESVMHGANASLWARVPFEVESPGLLDAMALRMQYNDGFVAYLNGTKIAERNAPDVPHWNSTATGSRTVAQSLAPQEIDITEYLNALRPGLNVLAIQGLNATAADANFLIVPDLLQGGRQHFAPATPGEANSSGFAGLVRDTNFSIDRGFFNEPFDVEITTATTGATIYYTLDGTEPSESNGTLYTAAIPVTTTTTLRAAAFKPGYYPTNVDTQTYIFLDDVIRQPANPSGFPSSWGSISADYEMDPEVVTNPAYSDEIIDGLKSIPTISIVMPAEDLFSSSRGIYYNSSQRGMKWEHPTSVEILDPSGKTFQANSGIRIHGYSWRHHSNTPKHSFRLEFRGQYGPPKMEYKLFPDAPVERFDSIVLRAQGGRAWAGRQDPSRSQYLRDTYARDTARDMGAVDGHATLVHLYLNGLYWGLYNPVERPDAQMGEEYFGGSDEDYDALNRRTSNTEVIDGDMVRYNQMVDWALGAQAAGTMSDAVYANLKRYLAMDDFIDWFLRNQYVTNRDGLSAFDGNNQRAIGSRVGDPQFRFFVWDMEYSMWNATDNNNVAPGKNSPALAGSQNPPRSAWTVYNALRLHPEFRLHYADRVQKHFFNEGALTPAAAAERWEIRANSIYQAIIGESARWGDAKRATPYTRDAEWTTERNRLLTQYFPQRTAILLGQLRDVGLYPDVDAPVLGQHGGNVAPGFELTMTATDTGNPVFDDTVLFTQSDTARYFVPVNDNLGTSWTQVDFDDQSWARGPTGVGYETSPADYRDLIETQVRPSDSHADATSILMRIPLTIDNLDDVDRLLLRVKYDDGFAVYLNGQFLDDRNLDGPPTWNDLADSHGDPQAVVFEDLDLSDHIGLLRQGPSNVLAIHAVNTAANSSDMLMLPELVVGKRVDDPAASNIVYTLDGTDPRLAGGAVHPAAVQYAGPVALGENAVVKSRVFEGGEWSALTEAAFFVHAPATAENLAVAELNYHPHNPTDAEREVDASFTDDDFEFLELVNVGELSIDLVQLELSGGVDLDFAGGRLESLAPGERVLVVRNEAAFEARYGTGLNVAGAFVESGLGNGGDRIVVRYAGTPILDFTYDDGGDWPGRADGSGSSLELIDPAATDPAALLDGLSWRSSSEFGGTPGTAGSGPDNRIVVNEVLANSGLAADDAIELLNTTDDAIDLSGWLISDTNANYAKFTIPADTVLGGGEYLVYDERDFNPSGGVDPEQHPNDFALNGAEGEDVWLLAADAQGKPVSFVDHAEFPAAALGESYGRWPNGSGRLVPMSRTTLGAANAAPRIGPLVISEIKYDVEEDGDEFLELTNVTAAAVPLFDPAHAANTWRIAGIGYAFPGGVEVPGGGVVLVVPIDPGTFRSTYNVPAEVQIFGPYAANRQLSDTGERIRLLRPDAPTLDNPPIVPWLVVDQVDYLPDAPWPEIADGTGQSIARQRRTVWGDDPANWMASAPTPGVVSWPAEAQVVGRHVFYNSSSFDGNDPAPGIADDAALAPDKQPLFRGERAGWSHYTNYARGVTGLMIDVADASAPIVADDFLFHVGNTSDPTSWQPAAAPATVTVRSGAGVDGSDRVTLTWADYAIKNTWLQVTVLAANLGLPADDVFYFGNAVAEAGNAAANAQVTTTDLLLARNNPRNFLHPAAVDFAYDYNRDQRVNATDVLLARNNQTNFLTALRLIDLGGIEGADD